MLMKTGKVENIFHFPVFISIPRASIRNAFSEAVGSSSALETTHAIGRRSVTVTLKRFGRVRVTSTFSTCGIFSISVRALPRLTRKMLRPSLRSPVFSTCSRVSVPSVTNFTSAIA